MRKITKIIIHCSDSNNRAYEFDRIKHDHVNHNGWSDIGYHFGIGWDGATEFLRPISRSGAHVRGHNKDSIGVCVLGRDKFTREQFVGLAKLVVYLMDAYDIKPFDIYGHNDFTDKKTCPNFDVDLWKELYLEDALCL